MWYLNGTRILLDILSARSPVVKERERPDSPRRQVIPFLGSARMDESVEHGRDLQLPDRSPALGDLLTSHRRGLVASREQLRSDPLPVPPQVLRQLLHAHPVDAGTSLFAPHALQRS